MLNAAHANRKSPQLKAVVQPSGILVVRLTEHPSDVVHVKMVVLQRAPQPFLACLTACEALRQAAVDHRAAGGAILIARPEHVERVIDHHFNQGVAFEGGRGPGTEQTIMLKGIKAGVRGGGREAHQR